MGTICSATKMSATNLLWHFEFRHGTFGPFAPPTKSMRRDICRALGILLLFVGVHMHGEISVLGRREFRENSFSNLLVSTCMP